MSETTSNNQRTVHFTIITMVPLRSGQQIFITGDDPALGPWHTQGLALGRKDDHIWEGSIEVAAERDLEFKITRGTWETEEVQENGLIPDNLVLRADAPQHIEHRIHHWKDLQPLPPPKISGNYRVHESMHSSHLLQPRRVIVWLPPNYEEDLDRSYPVLYMTDGQQVFDPSTSTWGYDWQVDEWCLKLIMEGRIQELIVVAVYNTGDRPAEYNPAKSGHDYARFLIEELKPFIDDRYRTMRGREKTAVAGSSLGGLMAFFLAWEYPDVFFGAACLSPAFAPEGSRYMLEQVAATKDPPDSRFYMYCGGGDELERQLLDSMREMAVILQQKQFVRGRDFLIVENPKAIHHEEAWAMHTDHWLIYLFGFNPMA